MEFQGESGTANPYKLPIKALKGGLIGAKHSDYYLLRLTWKVNLKHIKKTQGGLQCVSIIIFLP